VLLCFDTPVESSRWFKVAKEVVVCTDCHNEATGEGEQDDVAEVTASLSTTEPPPFMFRPVKEEVNSLVLIQ